LRIIFWIQHHDADPPLCPLRTRGKRIGERAACKHQDEFAPSHEPKPPANVYSVMNTLPRSLFPGRSFEKNNDVCAVARLERVNRAV
jgi:hypothetical protein